MKKQKIKTSWKEKKRGELKVMPTQKGAHIHTYTHGEREKTKKGKAISNTNKVIPEESSQAVIISALATFRLNKES